MLAEFTLGRARPKAISYKEAVELYLEDKRQAKRPSTVAGYKLLLARLNFKGALADITYDDAARKLGKFTTAGMRSHILVAARAFFNWCIKRRYISENPFAGLEKPATPPRTRVLSDSELSRIWRATAEPTGFNRIVRLSLLTGQRRGEAAQLRAEYVAGAVCTFPAAITKNGREHSFPLAPMALELVGSCRTNAIYILTGTEKPFNNYGAAKAALDKASGVTGWTLHDLRRSVATKMAGDLGIAPHVIERILNHITGTLSPLARVYNRATFHKEMAEALTAWETRLAALIAA